ncbi:hypothetical protein QQF64_024905 [Cirrhinus molitorella]|uniref:Ig-like domain-containing protein n=1 Tax=Cirrhinus molitorella TaxID=172907 RepID=A0ABR3NNB3_9TELE
MKYKNKVEQKFTDGNLRSAWHCLKTMASINNAAASNPKTIQVEGSSLNSLPDDLNSFFTRFESDNSTQLEVIRSQFKPDNSAFIFSTQDVVRAFRGTKERSSPGPDNISGRVLSYLIKYADDTVLLSLLSDSSQNHGPVLQEFVEWCDSSHLELNVSKTKEMVVTFSNKQREIATAVTTFIHGMPVELVEEYKYLVDLQQPSISHSVTDGWFVEGPQGPVITRGHSFTIICSTKSQFPGGSFLLFRGSNITRSESAVSHSASFSFPEADYSHEGNYSCVYEVSVSSRSFRSSASELLLITITVDLQQPSISHSAPDGWFVEGPQGPVITKGHSFTIICSTQYQFPGGFFHLFRGSNITRSESSVNHSASFFFPEADYSHEGNYSCVYEVSISSRSFRSSASELLLITITASLLPVIGAAVSAVLLLLSVLIITLLLKRRQKQRNKETHIKSYFRKGAANSCTGTSNQKRGNKKNENHEADYENLEFNGKNVDLDDSKEDCLNVNCKVKSVVDKSDDNIYESCCDEY